MFVNVFDSSQKSILCIQLRIRMLLLCVMSFQILILCLWWYMWWCVTYIRYHVTYIQVDTSKVLDYACNSNNWKFSAHNTNNICWIHLQTLITISLLIRCHLRVFYIFRLCRNKHMRKIRTSRAQVGYWPFQLIRCCEQITSTSLLNLVSR